MLCYCGETDMVIDSSADCVALSGGGVCDCGAGGGYYCGGDVGWVDRWGVVC